MNTNSYFMRTGQTTFEPTLHSGGVWSDEDYHFSPVAGLMVHAIERSREHSGNRDLQLARVSFDILGRLPFTEIDISIDMLRPGRSIELVQATASIEGRSVIMARAWYLLKSDTTAVAASDYAPLPAPEECPTRDLGSAWTGGFMAQLEARQAVAARPGRGATWLTSPTRLLEDEDSGDVAEYFARIDTANGIAARQKPDRWAFPNVDLTVHLFRRPVGSWTGLDTTVAWGNTGTGVTSSILHDIEGPLGHTEQCLTLRKQCSGDPD